MHTFQSQIIWIAITWMTCGILDGVTGFATGAPKDVCLAMHTAHDNHKHQLTEIPYKISFSRDLYSPEEEINMTLAAPDGRPFKGFMIVAHRSAGDTEMALGRFVWYPAEKAQAIGCVYNRENVLTHKNNISVTSLEFTWKAPSKNEGDIVFEYMVVASYEEFWHGHLSPVLKSDIPLAENPVTGVWTNFTNIDWDECGESKGCFLYPKLCTGSDCTAGVTFQPDGNYFVFEMFAANNEYISIGFSDDIKMGHDHTVTCTGSSNHLSLQNGYNPDLYNARIYKEGHFSEISVHMKDGNVYCRYKRALSIDIFTEGDKTLTFDLTNKYYLFLAWGNPYPTTEVLAYHTELPAVSDGTVDFYDMIIVRGSSLSLLTQIHGILMMVAWILLVGMTTIIPRHYKDLLAGKLGCGVKIWFQVHRSCAILVWTLTAAAFVIIFVQVKALSTVAKVHSYCGIALMAAVTLQLCAGLLRPDLDSKWRPVFNIGHLLVGKACHILSAVTIFFAFYAKIVPSKQREFAVKVLITWVCVQVLAEILMEFRAFLKPDASEKYEIDKKDGDKNPSSSWTDMCVLFLYFVAILAVLVAALLSILLF